MAEGDIRPGEAVYIRSLSTRRAAVAAVLGPVYKDGRFWVHIRLVTAWYDWDGQAATEGQVILTSGDSLLVDPKHVERIRR